MQQPQSTENPVQWSTRLVLEWMRKYDDSKEEVKKKILEVIERNDIDGLTLKQLRADSEEIHTLFPSLKERLTFKSMLRDIFKDSNCSQCHNNGGSNNSGANIESTPPPPHEPPEKSQLGFKIQNVQTTQGNHRNVTSHSQTEEINAKSTNHVSRTSPRLSPRSQSLPRQRQDAKENAQVNHVENRPSTSRAKMSPISVSAVPHTKSPLPPRELTSPQIQRFIAPQGMPNNQLMTHTSQPVTAAAMYPFTPIAGQFNVSVANQALAAVLAARGLPRQQTYPPHHQQHQQVPISIAGPSGQPRASLYSPPSQQRSGVAVASAAPPPASAKRVVEILDKDDKDPPTVSTSSASDQNSHPTSNHVPVALPLIGTRGRPATKGAIRSAKISQKYKKIIQRMKSAHKQVIEIPYPAPLPSFSQLLRQQIGRGNIANFRSRFTYECAQYYMSLNPTPSHTEYRNISKTVVENFPVLSSPDEDVPWRKFNNHLSQAIRNIRRQLRSVPNSGYPPAQKRKYWRNLATQVMCSSTLSLTQLTQQQQRQQSMTQGIRGTSPQTASDRSFDELLNEKKNPGNEDVIILKEDEDEDDDDDFENDKDVENDDEEDGIIPAEWVNNQQ